MECRQAFDIDLAGFLAEPRAAEFDAFRAHYPRCQACSAEVRAWTELHAQLASAAHPTAAALAGYAQLATAERAVIDRHCAVCPSCREELRLLDAFDPAVFAQPAAAPARERRTRGWMEALAQVLWHPAFAYGLAILIVVPILWRTQGPGRTGDTTVAPQAVAVSERSQSRAKPAPERDVAAPQAPPAVERLAKRAAPAQETAAIEAFEATELADSAAPFAAAPTAGVAEGGSLVAGAPASPRVVAAPVAPPQREPVAPESLVLATGRSDADAAEPGAMLKRDEGQFAAEQVASLQGRKSESRARQVAAADAVGFAGASAPAASEFDAERSALAEAVDERLPALAPVVLASAPRRVSVSVPVTGGAPRAVDVLVSDASYTRSVRLRAQVAAASQEFAIQLEKQWLTPGAYRVSVDDGATGERVYTLSVVER